MHTQALQAAQRELSEAVEHHPRIVALQQALTRADQAAYVAYTNAVGPLTELQTIRDTRQSTLKETLHEISERQYAERKKVLGDKQGSASLTPEERTKLDEIDAKYNQESREARLRCEQQMANPDEKEQELRNDLQTCEAARNANTKRYEDVYKSIAGERARVTQKDPALAALAARVAALNERHRAVLAGAPELAACEQRMDEIKKQRADLMKRLGELRSASRGAQVPRRG